MSQPPAGPSGSIYDLGYRRYEGARLGRGYAVLALYLSSLRGAFGLGRGAWSKVFPMGLTLLAFIPAIIQLGIASLLPTDDIEIFRAEDYYDYVQVILVLFCAAVGPDIIARDQRSRTLALYFSRALLRSDYALAKYAAFATAMLLLTLGPQALLYLGNGLAVDDFWGYVSDEWDQATPIVLSAVLLSAFLGAITLAIAAQSPRRAYTTVAIIAMVFITSIVAGILGEVANEMVTRLAVLVSPLNLGQGATYALFQADYGNEGPLGVADLPGSVYVGAVIAWTVVATAVVVRRFMKVQA